MLPESGVRTNEEVAMIVSRLDVLLAKRKMRSRDLAKLVGISEVNISRIKTGKINAIRFSTLEALCRALDCQPGDLLEYAEDEEDEAGKA